MSNDPSRRHADSVAAVPVGRRPFNYLWLLPLLLIPLLLFVFCSRRADEPRAGTAGVTGTPGATGSSSTAGTLESASMANPFADNAAGSVPGKAVLNFEANATTPNTDATGVINRVAAYLKANPSARVSLKGYTDSTGTADVNRRLTEQRVGNVKSALVGAGVPDTRIDTANFGEGYPVTDNSTAQAREANRRVEIELLK